MMPTGFPQQTNGTWSILTHPHYLVPFIMISPTHPLPFPWRGRPVALKHLATKMPDPLWGHYRVDLSSDP
jgi:hypothetical protein